ncbi:hypothetical protein [Kordiimonas marina]|uniref:hypothetical protein n=1 Tax=Kordiimonas marina TaxID=2872312 RepID=UPI001FF0FC08|nr:hypothetical protein [Kordiimonas marina]MCJ9429305.1 hypothetical protein [Kordiimonas marina]
MNLDWQICRHLAETLTYSECLHVEKWVRHSGAQGGRAIEMVGIKGHVDFVDPPDMVRRLMALGETTHAGGGAALGLGRFMVS